MLGAIFIDTVGTPVTGTTGNYLILCCPENRDTVSGSRKVKATQPEVVVAEMEGNRQRDVLSMTQGPSSSKRGSETTDSFHVYCLNEVCRQ